MIQNQITTNTLSQETLNVKRITNTNEKIQVIIEVPESIHENIRQQKINRIYDILSSKVSQ